MKKVRLLPQLSPQSAPGPVPQSLPPPSTEAPVVVPPVNPVNDPRLGVATGPRPEAKPQPKTYEEYVEMVKYVLAHQGKVEMATLWAQLAQAEATNKVATELERLNVFLGADDFDETHPESEEPRLSDTIADGIVFAVTHLKDELLALLPPDALTVVKAQMVARWEELKSKKD